MTVTMPIIYSGTPYARPDGDPATLKLVVDHGNKPKEVRVYTRRTAADTGDGICRADGALVWEGAMTGVEVWFKVGSIDVIQGELRLLSSGSAS